MTDDQGERPAPAPMELDKETLLLAFDSAIASLMGMRHLVMAVVPDGMVVTVPEQTECLHKNRAPSYPAFCLDCEQEVGVSPE
jgi:hypothetical protein